MTRQDIINSSTKIIDVINSANIPNIFITRDDSISETLSSMRKINQATTFFSKNDFKILDILNLSFLLDDMFWQKVIDYKNNQDTEERMKLYDYVRAVTPISQFLSSFINLLKREFNSYDEKDNNLIKDNKILNIILPEEDKYYSSPDRIVKVLSSIQEFYNAFTIIYSDKSVNLSVVAIDSGSDKSFDFFGAAKIIETIKTTLFDIYDRVIFHREDKHEKKLDLIAKSLPVMEKVAELEKSNALSAEQAELLRRNILGATNKFINSGAMLPEFSEYTEIIEPRKLMTPQKKLLNPAEKETDPDEKEIVSSNDDKMNNLSKDEQEQLNILLKKMNQKNDEDSDSSSNPE